jgi:phosphoglycolate phosphatase
MMDLTAVTHILWDWNGTLIDDAWLCVDIMDRLLQRYDKPGLTLERYQRLFDFPVRDYYQRLGFDFSIVPFEQVGSEFMEEYYERWRSCALQKDVPTTLQRLSARGLPQAILTAAPSRMVKEGVDHFGIASFFQTINGLDHHYADGKLAVARDWLEREKVSPSSVLLIGDTTHDFEVAHDLGMACVLISSGHHHGDRLHTCGVPVLSSFDGLRI